MTKKQLKGINGWWMRHAWGVIASSFVALAFFLTLGVLGLISPPDKAVASNQDEYTEQKSRIDKLEKQVESLDEKLGKKKDNGASGPTPAKSPSGKPSSLPIHLNSPTPAQSPTPAPVGGRQIDGGSGDTSGTSRTKPTPTPPTPEEPGTPPPSPTPGFIVSAVSVNVVANLQRLADELPCRLIALRLCR